MLVNGCNETKSEHFKGVSILSVPTVFASTLILFDSIGFVCSGRLSKSCFTFSLNTLRRVFPGLAVDSQAAEKI